MSEKIYRLALTTPQKLMIKRITIPTLRGVPLCVKQDEVKKNDMLKILKHSKGIIIAG